MSRNALIAPLALLSVLAGLFVVCRILDEPGDGRSEPGLESDSLRSPQDDERVRFLEEELAGLEARINALESREVSRVEIREERGPDPTPVDSSRTVVAEKTSLPSPVSKTLVAWLRRVLPDDLGNATAEEVRFLRELELGGKDLTDSDLQYLHGLDHLVSLNLEGNAITDAGLASLRGLASLSHLDLGNTSVTGWGLANVDAPSLEWICLDEATLGDIGLHTLRGFASLEKVKINRTDIHDDTLAILGSCASLREIELDGTAITEEGLRYLLSLNPRIHRIEARGTSLTSESVQRLKQLFPGCHIELGSGHPWQ